MPPKKKKIPVQWQFKIDLRKKNSDEDAWQDYTKSDGSRLEKNYISMDDEFHMNSTYAIDFEEMIQYRRDDRDRQRPIRRIDEFGTAAYVWEDLPATPGSKAKKAKTAKKSPKKKKGSNEDKPGYWQWKPDHSGWETYADEDSELLETLWKKKIDVASTDKFSFSEGFGTEYKIDFKKMTQTNLDSNTVRKIRRTTKLSDDGGFAALLKAKSAVWGSMDGLPSGKKKKVVVRASSMVSLKLPDPPTKAFILKQVGFGAQSKRPSKSSIDYGLAVKKDKHGSYCFDKLVQNEERLCGEYAVFYHSYSFAALLYEVQAAVAAVLFRFKSNFASLPRLLKKPFIDIPDANALLKLFNTKLKHGRQDHDPRFRAVGICASTNLVLRDPEATPSMIFLSGYSQCDLSFTGVLKELLIGCSVPSKMVNKLSKEIVKLSEEAGLDVSTFGGKHCKSGRPGHLLQIFLKRELVDRFVYAGLPMGPQDSSRTPLGNAMAQNKGIVGQVRICFNPSIFMRAQHARMFVYSADPTFHERREEFQVKLRRLLDPILNTDERRISAAVAIHGGVLPDWFEAEDQTEKAIAVDNFAK